MVGCQPRVVHQQTAHVLVAARVVRTRVGLAARDRNAGPEPVLDRVRDRYGHRRGVHIPNAIAQDGDRQTGVVRVVWNERAERVEADADRHAAVVKRNPRQRKFAREGRALQPLQAGSILRAQAECALVGRLQPGFEDADERRPAAIVHTYGRERVRRRVPLVGPVEDFPVTQLTSPAQADATGADATKGERDLRELRPGERSRVRHARRRDRRGRTSGSLR